MVQKILVKPTNTNVIPPFDVKPIDSIDSSATTLELMVKSIIKSNKGVQVPTPFPVQLTVIDLQNMVRAAWKRYASHRSCQDECTNTDFTKFVRCINTCLQSH